MKGSAALPARSFAQPQSIASLRIAFRDAHGARVADIDANTASGALRRVDGIGGAFGSGLDPQCTKAANANAGIAPSAALGRDARHMAHGNTRHPFGMTAGLTIASRQEKPEQAATSLIYVIASFDGAGALAQPRRHRDQLQVKSGSASRRSAVIRSRERPIEGPAPPQDTRRTRVLGDDEAHRTPCLESCHVDLAETIEAGRDARAELNS